MWSHNLRWLRIVKSLRKLVPKVRCWTKLFECWDNAFSLPQVSYLWSQNIHFTFTCGLIVKFILGRKKAAAIPKLMKRGDNSRWKTWISWLWSVFSINTPFEKLFLTPVPSPPICPQQKPQSHMPSVQSFPAANLPPFFSRTGALKHQSHCCLYNL